MPTLAIHDRSALAPRRRRWRFLAPTPAPRVAPERLREARRQNALATVLWLVVLAGVLGLTAFVLGGPGFVLPALALLAVLGFALPQLPAWMFLRMQRARPIERWQAPALVGDLEALAARAGLERVPALHLVPDGTPNAFSVGSRADAAIAVSNGLLRELPADEARAVLAHEVAHLASGDVRLKAFADLLGRVTGLMARVGLFLVLLNLPLVLFGQVAISWTAALLLFVAPTASGLVLFALSRTRELDADVRAVEWLGEGRTLARALARIERATRRRAGLAAVLRVPDFLRTHPATEERVARLLAMERAR